MRRFLRRLHFWINSRRNEAELAEEIELHRAMTQERLERDGVSADAAAPASRRALGNVTLAHEDAQAIWIPQYVDSIRQDVRYAIRGLGRQPGFTLVAALALAAGIGLTTSLFTVFSAFALRGWPVHDADRVITLVNLSPRDIRSRGGGAPQGFSLDEVGYFEAHARTAHGFVAVRTGGGNRVLGDDDARMGWVSGNYFAMLGVEMAYGRGFLPHEDRVDSPVAAAVLSHGYWRRRFGGNPTIVGQEVRFEELPFTVVGVASPTFTGTTPERVDVWMPLATVPILRPDDRWVRNVLRQPKNCCLGVSARLAANATREEAQAELTLLDRQFRGASATPQDGVVVRGTQLMADPKGDSTGVFVPMFGGVLLVLLLACANVGNLLIARGSARVREIAMRLSLGASRARVVRQLLTESAVLAMLGGAAGILIASWLPSRLILFLEPNAALQMTPDGSVLGFACALSALSTLFFGLAPALHATRVTLSGVLNQATQGGRRLVLRNALLGVQMCAATVLLVSAGLLVRAVRDASTRNLGYSLRALSVVSYDVPQRGFDTARVRSASLQLAGDLASLDSSGTAVLTSTTPLGSGNIKGSFRVPGQAEEQNNAVYEVSPGYFDLLGIPLVAGRTFRQSDTAGAHVIVNESLARRFWNTAATAVGQRISVDANGGWNSPGELEIVGVVGNASMMGIGDPGFVLYQPLSARSLPHVIVRTTDRAAIDAATAAVSRIDRRLRVRVLPLADSLAPHVRASRVAALLAGALGGLALVLASVGMFGVFAYWVQQRTREIGVRMALGARSSQVVAVVLRASAWAIGAGVIAGAAGAMAASRLLQSYLFGLSPLDPIAYSAVMAVLAASATLATYLPARRATQIDPAVALRWE